MSEGATQNGGIQAASTGEAAPAAGAVVAATAATAAPAAAAAAVPAAPATPLPAAPAAAVPAAVVVPAAVAVAAPAAAAADADCKPVKKKAHRDDAKKDGEEEHARAPGNDEDQNLSQPADGCVLPQTGQAAPAAEAPAGSTPVYDDGNGGGISSGLLIGAGVLAAVGVGVLALSGGDDEDKNAPPVANADTATVAEGATLNGSVATNDTDPNNDPLTFALTGTAPAGLTFNTNGTFVFDANNAAYNSLAAGATQVLNIPYTVSDGRGGTATATLTITVTGTNDAPTVVADTAAVNEDATITGNLRTNDTDPDTGANLTYTVVGTAPAGLTVNADGTYTFNAGNAAYQNLAAGQTRVVTANIAVSDGSGTPVNTTLTITVTGTNDAPVAVVDAVTGAEDTSITGSVATNDTDIDTPAANLVFTVVGTAPAGFTLNPNGTFTLDTTNAAYQDLNAGQTRNVVINYRVADGQGGTATSTLTITVTGVNDGPLAVADVLAVTEDTAVVTGNVATNDNNSGAAGAVTYTLGAPVAGLTLNPNGTFSFDPSNAAYSGLNAGQTQNVVANVIATDASGRTSTSTLTITVTGVTDVINLDVDTDANLNTRAPFDGGFGNANFTDDDDVPNTAIINNFGADDYITFDAPFNGANRVSFANIDFDGDGIANDLAITTNKNGTVSDLILRNVLSNEAAQGVISDEAAADAAIGAGFDNFRTTTQSATPTNVSLDIDNDNNLTSVFTIATAANTGTFNFTDDFAIANTVLVNDFGADDTLTFNTAASNVSFASGDFDNDGVADDLRITTNNGGVVSDIILANSVAAGVFVSTEAQAEAALGAGTDNFLFNGTVTPPPPPPPAGTTVQALEADTDNNLNTYRNFDAGLDGFRFTDDADSPNTATITNFGNTDRIVFEAGNTYSFANIDFNQDGTAGDLAIVINKNGTVSEVVLLGAVDPNAFFTTDAAAEAALNQKLGTTGIDYFSFA